MCYTFPKVVIAKGNLIFPHQISITGCSLTSFPGQEGNKSTPLCYEHNREDLSSEEVAMNKEFELDTTLDILLTTTDLVFLQTLVRMQGMYFDK